MADRGDLESLAISREISWKEKLRDLPDDPKLMIAALATLLGLDAQRAMLPSVTAQMLQQEADERARSFRIYNTEEEIKRIFQQDKRKGD